MRTSRARTGRKSSRCRHPGWRFPRKRGPGEAALPTTKDGSNPTTDGANALGFLVHGDAFLIKLASKVNFKMIAESGSFEVNAELVEVG